MIAEIMLANGVLVIVSQKRDQSRTTPGKSSSLAAKHGPRDAYKASGKLVEIGLPDKAYRHHQPLLPSVPTVMFSQRSWGWPKLLLADWLICGPRPAFVA